MNRSELLPEIFFDESLDSTEMELFQNKYLRSILKYQHGHLIALVKAYCMQMNPDFSNLNERARNQFTKQVIQNNQALRNQCVGLIVGFLEPEQFSWFLKHKTDCSKRILQMTEKRVLGD